MLCEGGLKLTLGRVVFFMSEDVSYLGDEKIEMIKSLDFDNLSIRPVRRRDDNKMFILFE